MDYSLSDMFALQQRDDHELIFQIPSYDFSCQEQTIIGEDLVVRDLDNAGKRRTRRGDQSALAMVGDHGKEEDSKHGKSQKVMMHREIERQRREEMAKLYASLRSLLPLEFIKGKRSISDHMHQAVSYIKFMQENIEKLSIKREKLKKISNASVALVHGNSLMRSSSVYRTPNTVMVSSCQGGLVEILINGGIDVEQKVVLSRVLIALLGEGLSVVSCISTTVNDRLLHTLQSEVSNLTCINLSMLQQKLSGVVNTELSFN